jgi:hypothetical protein
MIETNIDDMDMTGYNCVFELYFGVLKTGNHILDKRYMLEFQ